MQEDLPRLARELRKETCPRRVIDEALRRIAAETPPPRRPRYIMPVALAGMVLLCGLLVRWWPAGGSAGGQPKVVPQQAHSRVQAARDTERALSLIGTLLLQAGAHSEDVISNRALPPLREGFDKARNKIIRHTEL
jgi:hypothetical protein